MLTHSKSNSITVLVFFLLFISASTIYANGFTAVFYAMMMHILFGNIILGLFESFILYYFFKNKNDVFMFRIPFILIIANFFSYFAGFFTVDYITHFLFSNIYFNLVSSHILLIAFLFLLTIIFESPFYAYCHKFFSKKINFMKFILTANFISYIPLVIFYYYCCSFDFHTDSSVEKDFSKFPKTPGKIYFISNSDKSVFSCDFNGKNLQKVTDITYQNPMLFAQYSSLSKSFDLLIANSKKPMDTKTHQIILSNFTNKYAGPVYPKNNFKYSDAEYYYFGDEIPYLTTEKGHLEISQPDLPHRSFSIYQNNSKNYFEPYLETPFITIISSNPIYIEKNIIVFQVFCRKKYIAVLDFDKRNIFILHEGHSPLVVWDHELNDIEDFVKIDPDKVYEPLY